MSRHGPAPAYGLDLWSRRRRTCLPHHDMVFSEPGVFLTVAVGTQQDALSDLGLDNLSRTPQAFRNLERFDYVRWVVEVQAHGVAFGASGTAPIPFEFY